MSGPRLYVSQTRHIDAGFARARIAKSKYRGEDDLSIWLEADGISLSLSVDQARDLAAILAAAVEAAGLVRPDEPEGTLATFDETGQVRWRDPR